MTTSLKSTFRHDTHEIEKVLERRYSDPILQSVQLVENGVLAIFTDRYSPRLSFFVRGEDGALVEKTGIILA